MNQGFELQHINLNQSLADSINQSLNFMLEIEGRVAKNKLECYINSINDHYCKYLNIEKNQVLGKKISSIKDDFTNIYYTIMGYFFQNPTKDHIHIYLKKNNQHFQIADVEALNDENCELWQITAYSFRQSTNHFKVFICTKDTSKELYRVREKYSVEDIKNYYDKIINLSDMVSNLSHAWRQPLNALNFSIINLIDEIHSEERDLVLLEEYYKEIWEIINNLSKKIENFKAFFEVDYEKEVFNVEKYLDLVFEVMEEKISKEHIQIDVTIQEKIDKYGSPKEFVQIMYCIFFDIIECCKDRLDSNNRKLIIAIYRNKDNVCFDIKVVYNKEEHKHFQLQLAHLSMFNNILCKKMKGSIDLINTKKENKVSISFPLDI
ncbi:hypothetical protein CACET_c06720 [Clostridium aceticum]|uniref:Histidine kinase n=1 Tax=Clostridium aceticum TaxID=84022 RepID=A0A0D8IDT7_9CLOT|nr:HAMP domain-containing histidine kinase [Clostridium aceticum]AKL94182.1 hypothetical protein CACET_c06720 [Clostridium aceticum]KJF28475.1 hypothetical protein TZ02_00665 [Clostridium aceticum]